MSKKSDILVARVSAVLKYDGRRVVLHRGKTTAHAEHPIVRGHENLFTNLVVDYALDEESETNKRLREQAESDSKADENKEEPKSASPKKSVAKKAASAKKESDK